MQAHKQEFGIVDGEYSAFRAEIPQRCPQQEDLPCETIELQF